MSPAHPALTEALERLDVAEPIRATIAERHSEPHRHYHTLRHIDLMLRQLPMGDPFSHEMIAATLFHDIVYDPTRSDNEDRSLALFLSLADQLVPLDKALVAEMILATKSHHFREGPSTQDLAINRLLKADLSILWHPDPQVYAWYAQGVRREYAFVPDAQFHEARTRILTTLRDDLLASGQLPVDETDALKRNVTTELA